ncbi:hypothetical protein [Caminibacter sp.]
MTIIRMDIHGRIVYVNKKFEKNTLFLKKDVLKGNFWYLIDKCISYNTIEDIKKYIFSGKVYRGIIALKQNIENSIVYIEYEISPIDRNGNLIDGILRKGDIAGFIFIGKKIENIDKIIKTNNLKECIERRVFYKTV